MVLERRPILGGACVTEEVWPGARVSRASYVVSMLQPKVVSDLRLRDYGYRAVPLDPAYAALTADGPDLLLQRAGPDRGVDRGVLRARRRGVRGLRGPARPHRLVPAADDAARAAGARSRHPADLLSLLREGARAAGLSRRDVHDLVRIFTMSVADLLDDWFEHDGLKGSIASTGVVGVWAGPRTPGTAYNLLHHALGEIDGISGGWGQVIGGMGAISQAIARSAEAAGAEIRTGAAGRLDRRPRRPRRRGHPGRRRGDPGADRRLRRPSEDDHPRPRRGRALPGRGRPGHAPLPNPGRLGEDQPGALARRRATRASTDEQQHMLERTGVNLCPSIDYLERAWQDALAGRPAAEPYVEAELPSAVDSSLTDDGRWVMTMFTQYGPPDEEAWASGARERYADACIEHLARFAPNVPGAILEREVLAPPDLERIFGLVGGSIFQGEQGLDQMAFMRPSPLALAYSTPVDGLYLCGAGTHPGGGVMAAAGHNAAKRILRDRRFGRLRRRAGHK